MCSPYWLKWDFAFQYDAPRTELSLCHLSTYLHSAWHVVHGNVRVVLIRLIFFLSSLDREMSVALNERKDWVKIIDGIATLTTCRTSRVAVKIKWCYQYSVETEDNKAVKNFFWCISLFLMWFVNVIKSLSNRIFSWCESFKNYETLLRPYTYISRFNFHLFNF